MDKLRDIPKIDGLLPLMGLNGANSLAGRLGLGARGDSYYEYLLKQCLLSGQTEDPCIEAYQRTLTLTLTP